MSANGTGRLLAGCNVGERYWDFASAFYWFLQQRTRPAHGAQSPARRDGQAHPRLPLHGVGAFGCLAAFRRIDRRKGTYEAHSVLGINLGIDTASSFPCYNIYNLETGQICRSGSVRLFDSTSIFPFPEKAGPQLAAIQQRLKSVGPWSAYPGLHQPVPDGAVSAVSGFGNLPAITAAFNHFNSPVGAPAP